MRIKNKARLQSHGNKKGRRQILEILEAGMEAADPYYNTLSLISMENDRFLHVGKREFVPAGSPKTEEDCYELGKDIERIFVFGAGKGIHRIAEAIEERLGKHLTGGMVILKHGDEHRLGKVSVVFGSHPVPDQSCVDSSRRLAGEIRRLRLTKRDLVFTIIGNGSSSLMTLPREGMSVEDVREVTRILQIEKGLATPELNMVRNQLDQLKGGGITRLLQPASLVHLIPIDLDEPNALGGVGYDGLMKNNFWLHTLPDCSSPEKAMEIIERYQVREKLPGTVTEFLLKTQGKNNVLTEKEFSRYNCRIFGIMPDGASFLPKAMEKARKLGYSPYLLTKRTFVEAKTAGQLAARIAVNVEREGQPFKAPCALFMTGELTVAVNGETGIGGRNQEFALSGAEIIAGSPHIVIAAADTDGTDGPGGCFDEEAWELGFKNLTGGIVDGDTAKEARERGICLKDALARHNTSGPLWKLDSGIWATQNISIQDLIVLLIMDGNTGEHKVRSNPVSEGSKDLLTPTS